MRFFNDGRGLLRRVRWTRVVLVSATIGALVSWARPDDEAAAIGALKTITTSQSRSREDGPLDYGSLESLSNTTLIDGVLSSGTKQVYVFETCSIPPGLLPLVK